LEPLDSDGKVVESFDDAGGYLQNLMNVICTKLNLTTKLTVTNSFGLPKKGKWNGMIGVLNRKVYYLDSLLKL